MVIGGTTLGDLGGPNAGESDAFLARYDGAGNQLWIHQFGTSFRDSLRALEPDGAGGVFVGGRTSGRLGAWLGGGGDAFVAHYDGAGNQVWIRQFGTSWSEAVSGIALDGVGGVIASGLTFGSLGGPNAGNFDAVLTRFELNSCYPDCDQSTGVGLLDIFDFLCFQNSFVLGEPYACDCDPDPACDIFDFLCFQNAYVAGCP